MAGLVRLRNVQKMMSRMSLAPISRTGTASSPCRFVGTTGSQKSDTVAPDADKAVSNAPKKNWVSYGISDKSEEFDRFGIHMTFFVVVTICMTLGGFVLMYLPDFRMKHWNLREAYLQLRHRESLGLPPIDPNLIDPAKVKLPTDEELGDTEIII